MMNWGWEYVGCIGVHLVLFCRFFTFNNAQCSACWFAVDCCQSPPCCASLWNVFSYTKLHQSLIRYLFSFCNTGLIFLLRFKLFLNKIEKCENVNVCLRNMYKVSFTALKTYNHTLQILPVLPVAGHFWNVTSALNKGSLYQSTDKSIHQSIVYICWIPFGVTGFPGLVSASIGRRRSTSWTVSGHTRHILYWNSY